MPLALWAPNPSVLLGESPKGHIRQVRQLLQAHQPSFPWAQSHLDRLAAVAVAVARLDARGRGDLLGVNEWQEG
jgi:hypothetical protein